MRDYIIRRVLGMIPLILIVMIVSFGIFSLVPSPFAALRRTRESRRPTSSASNMPGGSTFHGT